MIEPAGSGRVSPDEGAKVGQGPTVRESRAELPREQHLNRAEESGNEGLSGSVGLNTYPGTWRNARRKRQRARRIQALPDDDWEVEPGDDGDSRYGGDPGRWAGWMTLRITIADPSHLVFKGALTPVKTYKVGQCESGWIPSSRRAR